MVREFASIISSISTRGESRVFLFGKEIFVFSNELNDTWQIATKVSSKKHPEIKEFLSYSFTSLGALAVKDFGGKGIYYLYNIPSAKRYVVFQKLIKEFLEEASSWSEILC